MYPVETIGIFTIQEAADSFTGTAEYGRAKTVFAFGGSELRLGAKLYGTSGNNYAVAIVDSGVNGALHVTQIGYAITVTLARAAGAITSTVVDVAAAINANAGFPFVASVTGIGVMSAVTQTYLSGGADVTAKVGNRFEWVRGAGLPGGYFYFEHRVPVIIRAFSLSVPAPGGLIDCSFGRVNLSSSLEVVSGTYVPDSLFQMDAVHTTYAVNDSRFYVDVFEAVQVKCAQAGRVKMLVQRA